MNWEREGMALAASTVEKPGRADHGKLRVFISHSRDDFDFADQLDATLRVVGFETSINRHAISGGEEWK